MADYFEVHGADQFLALSKALQKAGHKQLRKELHSGLKKGVTPVIPKARKRLSAALPKAIAASPVSQSTQVRTGSDAGIRVVVRHGTKRATNAQMANTRGVIRHPVFGSKTWVNQSVPSALGWFDETYRDAAPEIRRAMIAALQQVAAKVMREAKK